MIIDEIISEIIAKSRNLQPEAIPKYSDILLNTDNSGPYTIYPDMSRSIGDMVAVFGWITSEGSPMVSILSSFLLKGKTDSVQVYFDDGILTTEHKHNFTEFGYVAQGQFHTHIDNQDYIFNQGDIFLIDKNTIHNEYIYRKNMVVLFFSVANTFFDKTIHHEVYCAKTEKFIKDFVIGEDYRFIRLVPKVNNCQVPGLFEKIFSEIWRPHSGTMHLIIGYVEWIIDLIPTEYEIIIQRNNRNMVRDLLFKEIRQYLENNYQDIKLNGLIRQFGHDRNYFNRIIKNKTGMTFSAFIQSIKLEKAEFLLKTTDLPIEEVARQIGYENLSYFYNIFRKKFDLTPHKLRKVRPPPDHL